MRKALFMFCLLATSCAAAPCVSFAQTHPASWQNLSSLQPGQKIQIVGSDSKKYSGSFVSVSATAILITETTGERTLQKQDVRAVKLLNNRHRLRNTLIGAGAGAGAGAGISAGVWESSGFLGGKGAGAAVGAAIGGLGGAIVGALTPSHDTIYNVNSR